MRNYSSNNKTQYILRIVKTNQHIYAIITLGINKKIVVTASTLDKDLNLLPPPNKDKAKQVGSCLARRAKQKGIGSLTFNRKPYKFHGKIKELVNTLIHEGIIIKKSNIELVNEKATK